MPAPRAYGNRGRALPEAAAKPKSSGDSPYKIGKRFEYSVRSQLRRRGYFVIRSYASKGKVDEVAVAVVGVLFVQCKRRGVIGSQEWNALYDLGVAHGAIPVVAMKLSERVTGYFRLDDRRAFRSRERPWTRIDPTTLEPVPEPLTLI